MRRTTGRTAIGLGAAALVVVAATAGGVAVATDEERDVHVSGPEAEAAAKAALDAGGGGTANSVERDSENGATWEVEVTRDDGTTVDVRLDERYRVVAIEGDSEDE